MEANNTDLQIQKLIDKTKEDKIEWRFFAPNQLRWTQQNGDRLYITVLSRIYGVREEYRFTIQATNPNEMMMDTQSGIDAVSRDILENLFKVALSNSKDVAANIIDTLIESL